MKFQLRIMEVRNRESKRPLDLCFPVLFVELANDNGCIDPEHSERVIDNVLHIVELFGFVKHQTLNGTFVVQIINIYRWVANVIVKRWQVTCKLQRSGCPHTMPNETLRIIDADFATIIEYFSQGANFLNIAARSASCMSA